MTPADLRAALRRLDTSQVDLMGLLGVPRSTLTNWLAEPGTPNARRIPAWLPIVLALLEVHPEALATLREWSGDKSTPH